MMDLLKGWMGCYDGYRLIKTHLMFTCLTFLGNYLVAIYHGPTTRSSPTSRPSSRRTPPGINRRQPLFHPLHNLPPAVEVVMMVVMMQMLQILLRYMLWILRRREVWVGNRQRPVGTKGGRGVDVVGVANGGERIPESGRVEIVCVVVRVRVVAAVHWEGVDVWFVVIESGGGVVMMGEGVDALNLSGGGYSMLSRRGFGSVFEFDFEVFGANIGVLGADLFQGLGFGFVEFLVASVEEVVVCRAFFGIGGCGCTDVGM